MNPVAFERRCIRSDFVTLLSPYLAVRLSRAPCRRGASTLSVLDRFHELKHSGDSPCEPDNSSSAS